MRDNRFTHTGVRNSGMSIERETADSSCRRIEKTRPGDRPGLVLATMTRGSWKLAGMISRPK